MATPNANIDTLEAYWAAANRLTVADVLQTPTGLAFANRAAEANEAMIELVDQAANNTHVRAMFASRHLFTTALTAEAPGVTDLIFNVPGLQGWRVPRLVMLQEIAKASEGGFFTAADPSGVTSWIGSVEIAGGALASTLTNDPNGEVRLAALDCLRNVAIPVAWAKLFTSGRVLETLEEQIPHTAWSSNGARQLAMTSQLQRGAASVKSRMLAVMAIIAAGDLSRFPAFPTGDGGSAPTVPGSKPWYKQPAFVGATIGLVGGAVAQARLARTRG